jgi:surface protein
MGKINEIQDFIVSAQEGDLHQLIYKKVYGGSSGCTININGTTVQMGANSSIDVAVTSVSGGTGCFLGGYRPNIQGDELKYKWRPNTFVSIWNTSLTSAGSSTASQVRLPLISTGSYDFRVEWGDGTSDRITVWNQAQATHTYATAGVYQVVITGRLHGFRFNNGGDRLKLLEILKWGVGFRLGATNSHFFGCANLDLSQVEDILDTTGVVSFLQLFRGCSRLSIVNNINSWNTSNITTFESAFRASQNFNSDIGKWDTSNVTTMAFMFDTANSNIWGVFNQNIGNWDTSKVTAMNAMFQQQLNFNQDISTKEVTVGSNTYTAWDTSNVTTISSMFNIVGNIGTFNQNIGNWNTSKVTTMNSMFQSQPNFNQDISTKEVTVGSNTYTAWDTSNVTNMAFMLNAGAGNIGTFNQNIGNWNTSKVTAMNTMFQRQIYFNQDIGTKVVTVSGSSYVAWDTSNVTTINGMFNCTASDGVFNNGGSPTIGNWNTSKVTLMGQLFTGQPYFNQDIGTKSVTVSATTYSAWSVSAVTNMNFMFYTYDPTTTGRLAGSFNNSGSTSINNWDMIRVTSATDMFNYQIGFNQPIGNWNISGVTSFSSTGTTQGFMFGKTSDDYSSANYDALLIGWATRNVRPNQLLNMGTIKYSSAAVSARSVLTSAPNNWTIIDGGLES